MKWPTRKGEKNVSVQHNEGILVVKGVFVEGHQTKSELPQRALWERVLLLRLKDNSVLSLFNMKHLAQVVCCQHQLLDFGRAPLCPGADKTRDKRRSQKVTEGDKRSHKRSQRVIETKSNLLTGFCLPS